MHYLFNVGGKGVKWNLILPHTMVEHFGSAFGSVEDFFQETFANHAQAGFGAVSEGRNLMQGELEFGEDTYLVFRLADGFHLAQVGELGEMGFHHIVQSVPFVAVGKFVVEPAEF